MSSRFLPIALQPESVTFLLTLEISSLWRQPHSPITLHCNCKKDLIHHMHCPHRSGSLPSTSGQIDIAFLRHCICHSHDCILDDFRHDCRFLNCHEALIALICGASSRSLKTSNCRHHTFVCQIAMQISSPKATHDLALPALCQ